MTKAITTFFEAWGEADADKRADMIGSAMADTFTYADPRSPGAISDLAGLAEYVGMFSANAPGWTASAVKTDEVQGYVRALVAFGGKGPDGQDMVQHGTYFASMDADRISSLVGFVGIATPD